MENQQPAFILSMEVLLEADGRDEACDAISEGFRPYVLDWAYAKVEGSEKYSEPFFVDPLVAENDGDVPGDAYAACVHLLVATDNVTSAISTVVRMFLDSGFVVGWHLKRTTVIPIPSLTDYEEGDFLSHLPQLPCVMESGAWTA